ncbi:MAG: hypothetical protein EOP56_03915 [Sphingobacteriales bacterium]|nr:MAG: hypothetical protein EOP56_03915 [Sphingobacteriales bacterium]
MLKTGWQQNIQMFSLYLLCFALPMPFIVGSVATILVLVSSLLPANLKTIAGNLGKRKALWLWILFFVLHVYSYTYSDNKAESSFDIQVKLSFFILPIAIGLGMNIDRRKAENIFLSLVSGITTIALVFIARAAYNWYTTGSSDSFFYHSLVKGVDSNAVYIAWYTIFSISILLFLTWKNYFQGKTKALRFILALINIAFFILLSSKTLIAIFIIFIMPFFIIRIAAKKLSYLSVSVISLAFVILVTGLITIDNPIRKRYQEVFNKDVKNALTRDYRGVHQQEFNNLTLRLFLWRIGLENMNDCDLWLKGSGNGDVKDVQYMKMVDYQVQYITSDIWYEKPVFARVNLHNMFLQSLVMLGIPGLLVFALIVLLPFFYLGRTPFGYVFLPFFLSSFLFMIQEAALQTQAGSLYYTLFSSIFWCIYYTGVKKFY